MRGSIIYLEPEWEKEVRMLQEVPLQQGWCSKSWIATYKKLSMLIASNLNGRSFQAKLAFCLWPGIFPQGIIIKKLPKM